MELLTNVFLVLGIYLVYCFVGIIRDWIEEFKTETISLTK